MNARATRSLPVRLWAALCWLALSATAAAHAPAGDPSHWDRLDADEPAPAFTLTDQNGRRVALADFRGRVAIVTFLFTHCTDVCPLLPQMLARVDALLTATERAGLHFVGISVDPNRDTPTQLKHFLQSRGLPESRWTLLTGSKRELAKVAAAYGVVVRPDARGDLVHNTVFVLIDQRGHERVEFHGLASPAEEIAQAARALLANRRR